MSDPITSRLAEIQERVEKATEGPWGMWNPANGLSHISIGGKLAWLSFENANSFADDEPIPHWSDANFIAHTRTDIPFLLAVIKEQREAIEKALALHPQVTIADGPDNAFPACDFCAQEWPCETVAALTAPTTEKEN